MSQEVFELVCGMDMEEVETRLALQCAPLIAGIKISNLLIVPGNGEKALKMILESTDISYYLFLKQGEKSTYLLFRKNELINFLSQETVREILSEAGYQELELGAILRRFQKRYQFYMEKKGT